MTRGAETLKVLGSAEGLDARRAAAVGELARHQLSLDLAAGFETGLRPSSTSDAMPPLVEEVAQQPSRNQGSARQVVLHVHLTEGDPVARLERGNLATIDQIQHWCSSPAPR